MAKSEEPRVQFTRSMGAEPVLTMTFMRGHHLEEFLARRPSQKLKDELGERLFD